LAISLTWSNTEKVGQLSEGQKKQKNKEGDVININGVSGVTCMVDDMETM